CRKPDGSGGVNKDPRDCNTQFPITIGGNPNLRSETSLNRTLGVVLEPTNNISVALDLWEVFLNNAIIFGITPQTLLSDPARFAPFFTRGPAGSGAACAGCPGPIVNIDQTNLNLGSTDVRGLDIDAKWRLPAAEIGVFTIGFNGTLITRYEVQNPDGSIQGINGQVSPIVNGNGGV